MEGMSFINTGLYPSQNLEDKDRKTGQSAVPQNSLVDSGDGVRNHKRCDIGTLMSLNLFDSPAWRQLPSQWVVLPDLSDSMLSSR